MEMLFTGAPISAQDALLHGLVSKVVPEERLEAETLAIAQRVCQASRPVVALGKATFQRCRLFIPQPAIVNLSAVWNFKIILFWVQKMFELCVLFSLKTNGSRPRCCLCHSLQGNGWEPGSQGRTGGHPGFYRETQAVVEPQDRKSSWLMGGECSWRDHHSKDLLTVHTRFKGF